MGARNDERERGKNMFVKFKNSVLLLSATVLTETKLFDATKKETGWLFGTIIGLPDGLTSTDIDDILSVDGISEITVFKDDKTEDRGITGYNKIQLTNINYAGNSVEIQLTKWIKA